MTIEHLITELKKAQKKLGKYKDVVVINKHDECIDIESTEIYEDLGQVYLRIDWD